MLSSAQGCYYPCSVCGVGKSHFFCSHKAKRRLVTTVSRIERAKEWVVEQLQRFSDAAGAHVAPQKEVYLVEFVMRNVNGRDIVEIYADTDAGITIEECAQLTRQILEEIERSAEAQEIFGENFRLEISSPGVSRPLSLLRQYRKKYWSTPTGAIRISRCKRADRNGHTAGSLRNRTQWSGDSA